MGVFWYGCCYVKEEGSSPLSAITERRHMGLYDVPLPMSLLDFGIGSIMLLLREIFNMFVRNASPKWPMCCRCLIFSLSGPCALLFLLWFISSWN